MARLFSAVVSVVALLGILIQPTGYAHASSEKRVALVIGNSNYKDPSLALANPKNDADAIAAMLKSLNFEVQLVTNVSKQQMDRALEQFARVSTSADSALFFYAGHAIQHNGKNYLMPIDAQLEDEISIQYNLTSVDNVRTALDRASGVRILILDACRNNPIAARLTQVASGGQTRSAATTRGLARIDKTDGLVIAYATAPDAVAQDGTNSAHSPFTSALIKEMGEPGLEIGMLFRRVASDVSEATNGTQRPETSISLLKEYYLNQSDQKMWEEIRESGDIAKIREFLQRFPTSPRSFEAKNRLEILERAEREREQEARKREEEVRIRREQDMAQEIARLRKERDDADKVAIDRRNREEEEKRLAKLEEDRKKDEAKRLEAIDRKRREDEERVKLAKLEDDRKKAEKELAEKKEAEQRQKAVERLAALELERVNAEKEAAARKEDEARREEARKRAEDACKADQSSVNAAGRDEAKLKQIIGGASTCADAKELAKSVVASLGAEREQAARACESESKQLAVLVKGPGTVETRNKLHSLQSSLTCTSLAPKIVEAFGRVEIEIKRGVIRSSQVELNRLGCYQGPKNGDLSDATRDALKRVYVARGTAGVPLEIDEAVLSTLKTLEAPICTPPKPRTPPVVSLVAPPVKRNSPPPSQPGGRHVVEPVQAAPSYRPPAPARGDAPQISGLSF